MKRNSAPSTKAMIVLPTRELAVQCQAVIEKLAQFTEISCVLVVGTIIHISFMIVENHTRLCTAKIQTHNVLINIMALPRRIFVEISQSWPRDRRTERQHTRNCTEKKAWHYCLYARKNDRSREEHQGGDTGDTHPSRSWWGRQVRFRWNFDEISGMIRRKIWSVFILKMTKFLWKFGDLRL